MLHNVLKTGNTSPKDIRFSYNEFGKPFLHNYNNNLYFNLSHSNDYCLIGISKLKPIGVDIEYKKEIENIESLASSFLNSSEYNLLKNTQIMKKKNCFIIFGVKRKLLLKHLEKGLVLV